MSTLSQHRQRAPQLEGPAAGVRIANQIGEHRADGYSPADFAVPAEMLVPAVEHHLAPSVEDADLKETDSLQRIVGEGEIVVETVHIGGGYRVRSPLRFNPQSNPSGLRGPVDNALTAAIQPVRAEGLGSQCITGRDPAR